jgi:hypothetical protein
VGTTYAIEQELGGGGMSCIFVATGPAPISIAGLSPEGLSPDVDLACIVGGVANRLGADFSRQQGGPFLSPHAVLVAILLLVPSRHWWAYTLAAAGSRYFATQQEHLAASLCTAVRGFRCREERPGGRRDSHFHKVAADSHHAS